MIWYLLYPLRGTTEPPRLSKPHPIRRAFQAHGEATAEHWLLSILVTITISVLLCYQAVFQTESSAAVGLRDIPKHVWTSTRHIEGDRPADVVVHQAWVEGDFMQAINLDILRGAMQVQEALIGNGFDQEVADPKHRLLARDTTQGCVSPPPGQKWGWHSPLMYWDCSLSRLEQDHNHLDTINSRIRNQSVINLTLRPSTVFAGKRFSNTRLVAADALVITLFDQSNSSVGDEWNARWRKLAVDLAPDWTTHTGNGYVDKSRLYEFRFKEMTINDDLFLAASYIVTAIYVIWKMKQLRAVKSWFGLLVTICAKMTICIIASFTLCTHLGINLASIPRPWFPGVVFCFGLGNIFRLINVVLETPPELAAKQRIGNALGEVGHLSLAIAFQNLALLYICSRFVTPLVADFCIFAAVTLVFDLVYHLTFFVAVLSVDVRRLELSDSLQRLESSHAAKKYHPERQTWLAAVRQGNLPLSTRFAGTGAILSIITAVNLHYFDVGDEPVTFRALYDILMQRRPPPKIDDTWSPPPIKQARTPADWLRIQDHNTAKELFSILKPGAHSFIARIYNPLFIVKSGALGRDRDNLSLLEGLRHFAKGHAFPAALLVVLVIAAVTLLTNYLLWSEFAHPPSEDEAKFSVKTLKTPQKLDVVRLSSCSKGHLAAVSLDKSTAIWTISEGMRLVTTLQTHSTKPRLWPIYASALSDTGQILGFFTEDGQIGLWSMTTSRYLFFPKIDLRGQTPILFSFTTLTSHNEGERLSLIIISPDGYVTELDTRTGVHRTKQVTYNPIIHATLYARKKGDSNVVFVTKPGEVHILSLKEPWISASEVIAGLDLGQPQSNNFPKVKCVEGAPHLGLLFALRDEMAEIIDFNSRALVHTFRIGHIKSNSFRVMHPPQRECTCGASSVPSLSIVYAEQDTNHMMLQTYSLNDTVTSRICLGRTSDRRRYKCSGLDCAVEALSYIEPAGVWETTNNLDVVGIRKIEQPLTPSSTASDDGHYTADASALESAIKRRALKRSHSGGIFSSLTKRKQTLSSVDDTAWEAWTLSPTGEFSSRPLLPDDLDDMGDAPFEDDLFVSVPGPITRIGKCSVAVGFGNTVKIITNGKEVFDTTIEYSWPPPMARGRRLA